jgi:hypothetical protein
MTDPLDLFLAGGATAAMVPGAADVPLEQLRKPLPGGHSPTGPSSAQRVIACPGSVRAQAACPDQDSEDAQRGDRLHAATGRVLTDREVEALSPEDLAAVRMVVAEVVPRRLPGGLELLEHRLDLSQCGAGWGSLDWASVLPGDRAVIVDFKFGARAVPHPRHNWQTILYAVGISKAFGVQQIKTVIVRPAADTEWQVMEHTWTADELVGLASGYLQAVFASQRPDAPLVAGDHCAFCRAKDTCPARWSALAQMPRHGSFDALIRSSSPDRLRALRERCAHHG